MSTTMVETFDTQMLDYQNDDYSMHVSSSDAWFHDEAIMEDDGLPIDDTNVSIEVDMEPYDEERNTEYEMVDGSENYDLQSAELLDVEVYDASRATTPTAILAVDTPTLPLSEVADDPHVAHDFVEPLVSVSAPDPGPIPPPTELPEAPAVSVNTLVSDVAASSDLPVYLQPEELTDTPGVEFPEAYVERALSPTNVELDHDHSVTTRHSLEATAVVAEQDPADFREQDSPIDDQETKTGDIAQHDGQNQLGLAESTSISITHQPSFHDDAQGAEEHRDYESAVSSGDPHEISDGVFIDPPPAVLLSVALVDQLETSLFNAPSLPEAASPAPSDHQSDVPVLLSHLPILYYEPLSSVFEALRQDEHFANIGEIMNAELALDAYDLELVLSEDNVYAREVSLHDLNVLHDGFNYSGPLRLRLQMAGSRFIVRYHTLQEHVARLNTSEVKDGEVESQGDTSEAKLTHIQQGSKRKSTEPENSEIFLNTDESIQERPQVVEHNEAPQGENESHNIVSTAYEQEHHPDDNEDHESRQDYVGVSEIDHNDASDQKDEYHEKPINQAVHEGVSTVPDNAADAVQDEDTDTHVDENHDAHGEAILDRESEEAFESVSRDPLHTEDAKVIFADPSNHTPRINEFQLSPSNIAGNDQESPRQCYTRLDEENILKESDSGQPNLESLPDIDASDFDFNTEHNTNGNEIQANLSRKGDVSVTDVPDQENAEYVAETWDDDLDGEGDPDLLWEHEQETASNQSSITLASKTSSKRSISEAELGDNHEDPGSPPYSPGLKRTRVQ